jgi:hypothetical protein
LIILLSQVAVALQPSLVAVAVLVDTGPVLELLVVALLPRPFLLLQSRLTTPSRLVVEVLVPPLTALMVFQERTAYSARLPPLVVVLVFT